MKPSGPPTTLTELTQPISDYPLCDKDTPACTARIDAAIPLIYSKLNALTSRNLAPVIVRIDTIRKDDKGWWANGPAVWDEADEQNTNAVGLGMAFGALSLLSGNSPLGALADGANVGSSMSTNQTGRCLTSADHLFKGVGEVQIFLEKPNITSLEGFEEGRYVKVEFNRDFWKFEKGGLFDSVSTFYSPGNQSFGKVSLHSVAATVTPMSPPKLFKYCLPSK
jgi:hypothetical protein